MQYFPPFFFEGEKQILYNSLIRAIKESLPPEKLPTTLPGPELVLLPIPKIITGVVEKCKSPKTES